MQINQAINLIILCFFSSWLTFSKAEVIDVDTFIDNMVIEHDFTKTQLQQLLNQAKVKNSILRAMRRPGEAKPWYEYREIFLTPKRIKEGVKFWQRYHLVLEQITKKYGVPSEIIVAIIGVETSYGQNMGSFRVLDALYTLAFHYPKRADFFRKELEAFLLLTREEKLDPLKLKGSYAGAMGYGQFMPSSYRHYAVDFDGDNWKNVWSSVPDSLASVANYLKEYSLSYGWQPGQAIIKATQVQPSAVNTLLNLDFKPTLTVRELKTKGLLFDSDKYDDYFGLLIDLETQHGTLYWVGFTNFYMITRYNRSSLYAMAVYQLAEAIKHAYVN